MEESKKEVIKVRRFILVTLVILIFSSIVYTKSLTWYCDKCKKTFTFDPRNESYMKDWIAQHTAVCNSQGNTVYYTQPAGPTAQELEQDRVYTVHEYNDMGYEAYERGDYNSAVIYFEEAIEYDPHNPALHDNLSKAQEKALEVLSASTYISIPPYLTSVLTSLGLISIKPKLLLLHPSPHVRMEAQKLLVEETMKKITDAAATFVINQQLGLGKIEPMQWDTEAEKERKNEEVLSHSKKVENLRLQAHQEAKKKAEELKETDLNGESIQIIPGSAMSQLLKVSETGNW